MRKNNKGITLIALVVTIIVLLIIAGVSIITLTGDNGIINRTSSAKQKMEIAGTQEELQTAIEALKIDYHTAVYNGTIGEYIKSHVLDLQKALGDTSVSVGSNYKITYKGLKFTLDEQTGGIEYSASDNEEREIQVGDYVKYDPTLNAPEGTTTYTSYSVTNASSSKNEGRTSGYSENQEFDAAKYKSAGYRWRVLDIQNGTIRLISDETFGPGNYSDQNRTKYQLSGAKGYLYCEDELNAICGIFGHGKGAASAKSIDEDDILQITGFNPASPKSFAGMWEAYNSTITYTKEGTTINATSDESNSLTDTFTQEHFYYFDGSDYVELESGSATIKNTSFFLDFATKQYALPSGSLLPKIELLVGKFKFDTDTWEPDRTFALYGMDYFVAKKVGWVYVDDGVENTAYWGVRRVSADPITCYRCYDTESILCSKDQVIPEPARSETNSYFN